MKIKLLISLLLLFSGLLLLAQRSAHAGRLTAEINAVKPNASPNASPTPFGTDLKISRCTSLPHDRDARAHAAQEGLVLDARPFAINQSTGKFSFSGKTAHVTVVNMNPFIYKYKISVAQDELVSTAITDFIKILLPDSLTKVVGPQSGGDKLLPERVMANDGLTAIEERLSATPGRCQSMRSIQGTTGDATCDAIATMYKEVLDISDKLGTLGTAIKPKITVGGKQTPALEVFNDYSVALANLRDEEADAETTCYRANQFQNALKSYDLVTYSRALKTSQDLADRTRSLANDLVALAGEGATDPELNKPANIARCGGFNCFGQFKAYGLGAVNVLNTYDTQLNSLTANGQEMFNMQLLLDELNEKPGFFARTFDVEKRYELTQATISINREKLATEPSTPPVTANLQTIANPANPNASGAGGGGGPQPLQTGGQSGNGSAEAGGQGSGSTGLANKASAGAASPSSSQSPANEAPAAPPKADVADSVTIGRPRFSLSGGLVYSSLPRQTFQSVKGFVRDAQGNLSGTGNDDVVGYGQNSPRRLLPMVFLNSRLASTDPVSLFFSVGATAKHDDNLDIEYLLGPSLGLFNDRAILTFGAYGGKQQKLVNDVRIGQELPGDVGDAKLFRKSYAWKPGFSFSYSFSQTKKNSLTSSAGSGGGASDGISDEIRIGSIPFNLAVGLAYSSLEDRTYDEVVGLARDRQGNLTNGQTLTRIVGLTSSSNYRLTPLLLLHTRLTDFGRHNFYFTSGITGKKTDNDFDVEYLLGGSVNLYRRKLFVTFGTFIGKQQILDGDFFEGAKLDKTQNVTVQSRYVWKPTFSFSYDISNITKAIPH